MPLYDYHCSACNKVFENRQKMNDSSLPECPYCGEKNKIKKLPSAPALLINNKAYDAPQKILDQSSNFGGSKLHQLPKSKQNGLSRISYVDGVGYVESSDLVSPPPGSFGKEGRIVLVEEKTDSDKSKEKKKKSNNNK